MRSLKQFRGLQTASSGRGAAGRLGQRLKPKKTQTFQEKLRAALIKK